MWVILRANWFVGGRRIRRGNPPSTPVEVPDEYRDMLPRGAQVVVDDYKPPISEITDIRTLSEMARKRGGSLLDYLQKHRRPEVPLAPKPEDTTVEDAKKVLHEEEPPFKVIGGGWYEFPDGTRVQGLEKAQAKVREADLAATPIKE